ncbi:MAG TPA: HPr family phosphocarrier protein, partial [Gammaproteobacteria bacterium]|nr:HPr family phosphocarrier protein [Gammaproteobacteria bacterium]HAU06734.1 HPr family phosphocarrier protein [Gammaproteobacteria bacterium]
MIKQTFLIQNKLGLHARAAGLFVTTASAFDASIEVYKGERHANGKSIMGLMMLAAAKGSEITVSADGNDEQAAITAIARLVDDFFGEDQ